MDKVREGAQKRKNPHLTQKEKTRSGPEKLVFPVPHTVPIVTPSSQIRFIGLTQKSNQA